MKEGYYGCLNLTDRVLIDARLTATGWRVSGKLFVTRYTQPQAQPYENKTEMIAYVESELSKLLNTTVTEVAFEKSKGVYDIFILPHSCCMAILGMEQCQTVEENNFEEEKSSWAATVLFIKKHETVAFDIIANEKEYQNLMDTVEWGSHLTNGKDKYKWIIPK